ncbi:peptidoglycan/xylan/chitin deacetylase (PgdA/CDA1 family) [Pedobacter sp. UYEF25]
MYLVKSPLFLKLYYPKLLWNKSRNEKTIFLTFDDGPIPIVTPFVLKTLAAYQAKATFFCIGDNIQKNPKEFSEVFKSGHSIGNHTFNHLNGWKTDDETYLANVLRAQKLTQTNLFRPPYGRIAKSQIERLMVEGWKVEGETAQSEVGSRKSEVGDQSHPFTLNLPALNPIMWDVLSGDFDTNLSPEKCYQNVIKNTENGSIVVFHDSLKAFDRLQYALPRVLQYFTQKGYGFSSL